VLQYLLLFDTGSYVVKIIILLCNAKHCNTSATHLQHAATRCTKSATPFEHTFATYLQHICNTSATHLQHLCNASAPPQIEQRLKDEH